MRLTPAIAMLLAICLQRHLPAAENNQPPKGFTALFNGKDLAGWKGGSTADPRKITPCIDLIFIAKNLERSGDHATNIAEKIHYMIHGHEINRSRDDEK